jgi:hypothetical protein
MFCLLVVWSGFSLSHIQASCKGCLVSALPAHRRQSLAQCRGVDSNPVGACEPFGTDIKRICAALRDILRSSDFQRGDFETEGMRRRLNLAQL